MALQHQNQLYYWLCLILSLVCLSKFTKLGNSLSAVHHSCHSEERSALLQFHRDFIIDWVSVYDSNYSHPTTSSWATAKKDCCLWDGVKCSNETGHVIGLDLSSSCLFGTFPLNTTLFSLPNLKDLDLSGNNFNNSPIPPGFGHKLTKLTTLNLSYSAFSGEIPSDISQLSGLVLLDLSYNNELQLKHLSLGGLAQNFTRLNHLNLDLVDMFSSIPNFLANLTSLRTLSLCFCNLHGEFPTSIFNMPNLEDLEIIGNVDITGVFPEFRCSSPLRVIDLTLTSFYGQISPSLAGLSNLEKLNLFKCGFSGQVPSSIGNLTKLIALELQSNHLSGDMPSSFTNLTQLQYFTISNLNAMPDKLFPWLSSLKKLQILGLRSMNLTGKIPSVIANLTGLTDLYLDDNHFTGKVPHWLNNLTHLNWLTLKNNQLEGSLSPMISQLESLELVSLSWNKNMLINFDTLLKVKPLKQLELDGLRLTFPGNITTNESHAIFHALTFNSCNLRTFPAFLQTQHDLQYLLMEGNQIRGVIPLWFVNVTRNSLLELDLSYNALTSFELPTKVLSWDNIEVLNLNGNGLQGSLPIPSDSMSIYQLSNNLLSGDIPQDICLASSLSYLDLSFNHLSGRIPDCISRLADSLTVLNLQSNDFQGTIPPIWPKSCKLKMINLSQNQLTGKIPRSLANCWILEVIDIGNNQVNDSFPSWLANLPNLHILVLRHNNFHGRIATLNGSFGFHSLHIMDLSHNFHIGSLPSDYLANWEAMKVANEGQLGTSGSLIKIMLRASTEILFSHANYDYTITMANKGNDMFYPKVLNVLRVIDFSSNNFNGPIPDMIGELKGLQAINLSNNNLEGGIPSSLANIRDLQSLDLSNNKLSREIPQQLTQITSLEVFNVSHNLLIGPIPQGNQFNTFDNSCYDGNLGLCGGVLPACGNKHVPPAAALVTEDEKDEDSNVIDWIIRCLGCLSGLAIGWAIGKYMTDKHHDWIVDTFGRKKKRTRTKSRGRS